MSGCAHSPENSVLTNTGTATPQSSPATKRITSTDVVKVSAQPVTITAGNSAEAIVRAEIQSGYHINANPPTYSYLKATEITIPATSGISVASTAYPEALTKKFAFADQPLAVYEGNAVVRVLLRAERGAQKGDRQLSGKLRIQACDEEVCYPPGSLDVQIPLQVK